MPNRSIARVIEGRPMYTAESSDSVSQAARQMKQAGVGALLVVDAGRLLGIFTERDLLNRVVAEGRSPEQTPLTEVMTHNPVVLAPDSPFGHALHLMYENGFRHIPVVHDGIPVGVVSARDALGLDVLQFETELVRRQELAEIL